MTTELTHILLKRGNTAQSLTYTGPLGEVTVDTDLHSLRVHDGDTPGGNLVSSGTGPANTGNWSFLNNAIHNLAGGEISNGNISHGYTAGIILPTNGSAAAILLNNTYGNIQLQAGVNSDPTALWTFGTDGKLTLPADSTVKSASGDLSLYATGNVNIESKGHTFVFDTDTVGRFIMPPSGVIASSDQGDGLNIFTGNIATEVGNNWRFGTDALGTQGVLTLPQGSTINDTAGAPGNGNGQSVEIKPGGASNSNQLLRIYPTVPNPDGNHLHLTSGDLSVTDLFLGNDFQFVQIAVDGKVCIGTNFANHIWQFGTDGKITLPQYNTAISQYDGETTFAGGTDDIGLQVTVDKTIYLRVGDNNWAFGAGAGGANILQLPPGGDIKNSAGSSVLGGNPDGGAADNSAGLTIIAHTLSTSQYDTSGSVTYNIASAGASAAGIIIKGLTVDHTQVISGSFDQGSNTVNWNDYTISGSLWNQVASVTAFVIDSRGYTFFALVTDAWEVPHGPCLVEGTQITMADGTHRAIEDIAHGELIRVWNFDLGEFGEAQPIWIKVAEETDMHDFYRFSDGTELRTVGHHVFNKEAGAFTKFIEDTTPVGTTTFNEQGLEVTLVSKERVVAPTRYYNVWTQYHLNLFANGILTSNRFNNIYPVVDMKFVKDNRVLRLVDEFASIDEKYITGLRLQEQSEEYTAKYIADYVHNRLEKLDIANQVEQGI